MRSSYICYQLCILSLSIYSLLRMHLSRIILMPIFWCILPGFAEGSGEKHQQRISQSIQKRVPKDTQKNPAFSMAQNHRIPTDRHLRPLDPRDSQLAIWGILQSLDSGECYVATGKHTGAAFWDRKVSSSKKTGWKEIPFFLWCLMLVWILLKISDWLKTTDCWMKILRSSLHGRML